MYIYMYIYIYISIYLYIYIYIYIYISIYLYIYIYIRGEMAGITQKSCVTLFPLWSLKKILFFGGRGRVDVNQQKQTKRNSKFKFDKKSC